MENSFTIAGSDRSNLECHESKEKHIKNPDLLVVYGDPRMSGKHKHPSLLWCNSIDN